MSLDKTAVISASEIHPTSSIYKNTKITKSIVGGHSSVGDGSVLYNTVLKGYNVLNRNNYLTDAVIGLGTYTNNNTIIKNTEIGKFCCISWNVSMGGKNHNYRAATMFPEYHFDRVLDGNGVTREPRMARLIIGNDVWIGNGAIILNRDSGIRIGNGAVIGAGAVVTGDVAPYSVVAGCPARIIKMRFTDSVIERLQKLCWWDWDFKDIAKFRKVLTGDIDDFVLDKLEREKK